MSKSTSIYPMSLSPLDELFAEMYFVDFPEEWKKRIYELAVMKKPSHRPEYYLPTASLQNYIEAWIESVAEVSRMNLFSDDSRWISAAEKPDLEKVCDIIRIWISAEYIMDAKSTDRIKAKANELMALIDSSALVCKKENVRLFNNDGTAFSNISFRAFTLLAMSKLDGKVLDIFGTRFMLCRAGKELIGTPLEAVKGKERYSYALKLSVQTTPPDRKCMLNVKTITKRYYSGKWGDLGQRSNNINALVKVSEHRYKTVPICYDHAAGSADWKSDERKIYNLYNFRQLPPAENVLDNPAEYWQENVQILLPYSVNMEYANNIKVGTGVSITDKAVIFEQVAALLSDIAKPISSPKNVREFHKKIESDHETRRKRLAVCADMPEIIFEIYCDDPNEEAVNELKKNAYEFFGVSDELDKIIPIKVVDKPLGAIGDVMDGNGIQQASERIELVKQTLGECDNAVSFVLLPNYKEQKISGDPKNALRAGFASTGRLIQFIVPNDDSVVHRAKAAFRDMLRQLGYTDKFDDKTLAEIYLLSYDIIGVHVFTQLQPFFGSGKYERARFLPMYTIYNAESGKLSVISELFDERILPYRKALLRISEISRNTDLVSRCNSFADNSIKQKMLEFNNQYREDPAIVLVHSDGNTRALWQGISDSAASKYEYINDFVTKNIDIGKPGAGHGMDVHDGLRIIRLRHGDEVPDYYTGKSGEKHSSASGMYIFDNVFWALEPRPDQKEYKRSLMYSRTERPSYNFDEHSILEIFPILLQEGDDPISFAMFIDMLREIMPEYDDLKVKLPAPLHFAKKMKEYLFIK